MILLGITILGVINRTWAYVDEQIKIKAEQERLAEEKRKAAAHDALYHIAAVRYFAGHSYMVYVV